MSWSLSAIGALVLFSGCGALGDREGFDRFLRYASDQTGCLNQLDTQAEQFIDGTLSQEEVNKVFNCQTDSLKLFQKYVKGSDNGSYTVDDLYALTTKILITKSDVSKLLVQSLFQLKTSLFGGDAARITPTELALVVNLIETLRGQALKLLALIREYQLHPSPQTAEDFASQISESGRAIGDMLGLNRAGGFSVSDAMTLIREVKRVFKSDFQLDVIPFLFKMKALILGGDVELIESLTWRTLLGSVSDWGGILLSLKQFQREKFESSDAHFFYGKRLADRAFQALQKTFSVHSGSIDLPLLDALLEALPDRYLVLSNSLDIDRNVIKKALRPFFSRLLEGGDRTGIPSKILDVIFLNFDRWLRSEHHLEKIFETNGMNPLSTTPQTFRRTAINYASHLDATGVADVNRLIALAENYRPLFRPNEHSIRFDGGKFNHSLHSLRLLNWMNLIVNHLMRTYASYPDKKLGGVGDFKAIFEDYAWLGFEFGVTDPRVANIDERRFREANLFGYSSNGDEFFDEMEATYYVATIYSIKGMASRMLEVSEEACKSNERDEFGIYLRDIQCFREQVFSHIETVFENMPSWVAFYKGLNAHQKLDLQIVLEKAGRANGYSADPIGGYDVDVIAGIVHYIEVLFDRFNGNRSVNLNLADIRAAFPVFKKTIARLGDLDLNDSGKIEAVFTYLVKYGEAPKTDFSGSAAFLWWWMRSAFWSIDASRADIYRIVSLFSQ